MAGVCCCALFFAAGFPMAPRLASWANEPMKPTAYQLEKLSEMGRANQLELDALKAAVAAAKPEDVLPLRTRAHKLDKRLKEQKRLERVLGLLKKPAGGTA